MKKLPILLAPTSACRMAMSCFATELLQVVNNAPPLFLSILPLLQAFGAYWTAMWSLVFYLSLEKVWNFQLLSTTWYLSRPLLVRLVTMQVSN